MNCESERCDQLSGSPACRDLSLKSDRFSFANATPLSLMDNIDVKVGDLLNEIADAIICPANPWLNMSGGVNGEILRRRGDAMQQELHAHLRSIGKSAVEPGTIVVTGAGPLRAKYAIHVVAIDPFYDSSIELVCEAITRALRRASELGARTVAMPALATGYGHLSMEQFGSALAQAIENDYFPVERLIVVVRSDEYSDTLRKCLNRDETGV